MKAKLFYFSDSVIEIVTENGGLIEMTEGDTKESLIEAAKEMFGTDLKITEFTKEEYAKKANNWLDSRLLKATPVEKKIIMEVYADRGRDEKEIERVIKSAQGSIDRRKAKIEKDKAGTPEEEITEDEYSDTEASEEVVGEDEDGETEKAPKKKRNSVKVSSKKRESNNADNAISLKEALDIADSLKQNVNSVIEFVPFGKSGKSVTGVIKQVTVDSRVCRVYYRIEGEDGKLYHVRVNKPGIMVDDEKTEAYKKALETKVETRGRKKAVKAEETAEVAEDAKPAKATKKSKKASKEVKPEPEAEAETELNAEDDEDLM